MEANQQLFNCLTRFFSLSLSYAHQLRLTDRLGRATAARPTTLHLSRMQWVRERERARRSQRRRERETMEMGERVEIKQRGETSGGDGG